VWSPDGTKIAFISHGKENGEGDIYVMNADGSGQTNLTNNPANDLSPTWSPDGTKILFARQSATQRGDVTAGGDWVGGDVYVMNADGSRQTRLTRHPVHPNPAHYPSGSPRPKWSPDGTKIAFISDREGKADHAAYVMNADGSGVARLTVGNGPPGSLAWSPDGKKIAFVMAFSIHVMNADGSGEADLTKTTMENGVYSPVWSPDGKKIMYAASDLGNLKTDIYVMDADGTGQTNLTNSPDIGDLTGRWSSDGKKIVFALETSIGNTNIYVMNADGSGLTQLTNFRSVNPVWSPIGP
jgi:TolB protein